MKQKPNPFLAALAIVTALIAVPVANAADRIWDATTNTTWNTSTANWTSLAFTNGDNAIFSSASTKGALTLGSSVTPLNLRSNGVNAPATTTITGAAVFPWPWVAALRGPRSFDPGHAALPTRSPFMLACPGHPLPSRNEAENAFLFLQNRNP